MPSSESNNIQKFVIKARLPDFNQLIRRASTQYQRLGNRKLITGYNYIAKDAVTRVCEALIEYNIKEVNEIFLDIVWHEKNRRRDPDNIAVSIKFILDGLQKQGIIPNDGWNQIHGWKNTFKVSDIPKVEVTMINIRG